MSPNALAASCIGRRMIMKKWYWVQLIKVKAGKEIIEGNVFVETEHMYQARYKARNAFLDMGLPTTGRHIWVMPMKRGFNHAVTEI